MKKLLISAGGAAGLFLISLAAFLYPMDAVPEKEPVAEVTPLPQPTEMGVLPTGKGSCYEGGVEPCQKQGISGFHKESDLSGEAVQSDSKWAVRQGRTE